MYDKTLLNIEISSIKKHLLPGSFILDAGCGEGEGTVEYAQIAGKVDALDQSLVRIGMASKRIGITNVTFFRNDVRTFNPNTRYDAIISQRMLINLPNWKEQAGVLARFASLINKGGRIILCEGSKDGVQKLNEFRANFGLSPIPAPSHNCFISDGQLMFQMAALGFDLLARESLGTYFLLTRGIQPALVSTFNWASQFNKASASVRIPGASQYSRIKIWVFEKR